MTGRVARSPRTRCLSIERHSARASPRLRTHFLAGHFVWSRPTRTLARDARGRPWMNAQSGRPPDVLGGSRPRVAPMSRRQPPNAPWAGHAFQSTKPRASPCVVSEQRVQLQTHVARRQHRVVTGSEKLPVASADDESAPVAAASEASGQVRQVGHHAARPLASARSTVTAPGLGVRLGGAAAITLLRAGRRRRRRASCSKRRPRSRCRRPSLVDECQREGITGLRIHLCLVMQPECGAATKHARTRASWPSMPSCTRLTTVPLKWRLLLPTSSSVADSFCRRTLA
jgi:hypothetical protein